MLGTAGLLLAGDRLPWFLVGIIVLGLVITWLLAGNVRHSTAKLPPPITHARLLPDDDEEQPDGPSGNDHGM
ncbi:MAG: hypothetical protein ACRDMV_15615 [Streptosporangiales bacterium]